VVKGRSAETEEIRRATNGSSPNGFLEIGRADAIKRVVLNGASTLARATAKALRGMLKAEHVAVILGET
jgi:hypothetical protein